MRSSYEAMKKHFVTSDKCFFDSEWVCPFRDNPSLYQCTVCIENKKAMYYRIMADSLDTIATALDDNFSDISGALSGLCQVMIKKARKKL